jgi:hypothetical protein
MKLKRINTTNGKTVLIQINDVLCIQYTTGFAHEIVIYQINYRSFRAYSKEFPKTKYRFYPNYKGLYDFDILIS